ncbi:septation protein SepH [Saccharopolyspora sp. TS4A08]|uniref:Septation protein SepH n=1 Tax=Saccharopolyspora ipomoeae TaxID=3042027 RepID=A0ABT6PUE5_9PSEU|nr:septation protein SepH [Saccharopolyspora sp. TS4A08]MDI2031636.1 septation protein SepH [Saccharopolyspora sp. TS4A08]
MRALRVVGLDEDGESVICEDPENGERFTVPADERLRAASRGDLTRLGQVQIEMEQQMRPREIQARIRSGASVAQIAATSGLPEHRIERYAYPVLLERAQIAEMAQRAHPVREDGPDVQTLGEVIAHTFGMRGHEYTEANWDAWRGDDNKWVVQLSWQAGRSENSAHWVFHPGAHGGTVASLDEHAVDLLDPSPNRPLRTVRPVTELAREALQLDQQPGPAPIEPEPQPVLPEAPAARAEPTLQRVEPPEPEPVEPAEPTLDLETPEPIEEPAKAETESAEDTKAEPKRNARKSHPIVPSWEDVLLGVRSHR